MNSVVFCFFFSFLVFSCNYERNLGLILFCSKVTLHTDCSTALADQHGCYKSFVSLLKRYLKKEVSEANQFVPNRFTFLEDCLD